MSTANTRNALGWSLGIAAVIVAVATIAAAISVMGTPGEQRAARFDDRRVDDLETLDFAIRAFAEKRGALPADLAAIAREPGRRLPLKDPESGMPYEYRATAKNTYQLCAVFTTDTAETRSAPPREEWAHGRGRMCFDRKRKAGSAAAVIGTDADALRSGP
jgi:hypothetical protein